MFLDSPIFPISVVIGLRFSKVNPNVISRASFDRLVDPLEFLESQEFVRISYVKSPQDLIEAKTQEKQVFLFNGAFSEDDLHLFKVAKDLGYRIVYDIDTYLFQYPSYSNIGSKTTLVKKIAQYADLISVANERLYYAFQGLGNVQMIGNSYDVHKYAQTSTSKSYFSRKVVITNADNFKLTNFRKEFFAVLTDMLERGEISEVHLFSDFLPPELVHESVIYHGFVDREQHRKILSEQDFHLALVPIDVGLSFDDWTFNVSKNPFKYFIYSTAKIPTVYSDIALYTLYVKDGYNGLIAANTYEDWWKKITSLLNDNELCKRVADNAFGHVKETFDIESMQYQYKQMLFSLVSN